jgi:hypothetical protein
MKNYILFFVVLFVTFFVFFMTVKYSGFANYIAPYNNNRQKGWWERPGWQRFGYPTYSYWETFDNPAPIKKDKEDPVLEYAPDTPSPADLYNTRPYHLLSDEMSPPREKEALSCVNSRSCYATSFDRMIEKTGNYRQLTNNYKRGYPDSCSSPYQELVLNFYKADAI